LFINPFGTACLLGTTQGSIWSWRVFKKRSYLNTLTFFNPLKTKRRLLY